VPENLGWGRLLGVRLSAGMLVRRPTVRAKPTLEVRAGNPVGTTVQFRYRAVTKTGAADCSQATSLLVP
jgi:hypothetical protein